MKRNLGYSTPKIVQPLNAAFIGLLSTLIRGSGVSHEFDVRGIHSPAGAGTPA